LWLPTNSDFKCSLTESSQKETSNCLNFNFKYTYHVFELFGGTKAKKWNFSYGFWSNARPLHTIVPIFQYNFLQNSNQVKVELRQFFDCHARTPFLSIPQHSHILLTSLSASFCLAYGATHSYWLVSPQPNIIHTIRVWSPFSWRLAMSEAGWYRSAIIFPMGLSYDHNWGHNYCNEWPWTRSTAPNHIRRTRLLPAKASLCVGVLTCMEGSMSSTLFWRRSYDMLEAFLIFFK
jgi:hypothetical protein